MVMYYGKGQKIILNKHKLVRGMVIQPLVEIRKAWVYKPVSMGVWLFVGKQGISKFRSTLSYLPTTFHGRNF